MQLTLQEPLNMKGLKINLNSGNTYIEVDSSVSGLDSTIQNALVNIGTINGSDYIYTDKGTKLLKTGLEGKIVGFSEANHESNMAAIDTLFFSRSQDIGATSTERIGQIKLTPVDYKDNKLSVNASFTDIANTRTVGTNISL